MAVCVVIVIGDLRRRGKSRSGERKPASAGHTPALTWGEGWATYPGGAAIIVEWCTILSQTILPLPPLHFLHTGHHSGTQHRRTQGSPVLRKQVSELPLTLYHSPQPLSVWTLHTYVSICILVSHSGWLGKPVCISTTTCVLDGELCMTEVLKHPSCYTLRKQCSLLCTWCLSSVSVANAVGWLYADVVLASMYNVCLCMYCSIPLFVCLCLK